MREPSETGRRVYLRPPNGDDADEFLSLTRASRALHHRWVSPPRDQAAFTAYVDRNGADDFRGFLACRREDDAMAGVVKLSQVFRGSFNNAYLGFYGFAPFGGKGYMTEAVDLALRHAFRSMGLHRVEANLQPANDRSRALVERLGFRLEGVLSTLSQDRRALEGSRTLGDPRRGVASSTEVGSGFPRASEDQRRMERTHESGIL